MKYKRISSKFFIYLALFCLSINYIMYNALKIDDYKMLLRVLGLSLMILHWFFSGRRSLTIMQMIFLCASSLSLLVNGAESINLLALVIIGISMGDVDEKKLKILFRVGLVLVLIVIVFLLFGVMNNEKWFGGNEIVRKVRWTIGFGNPNHATAFFTSFLCLFILTRKKLKKYQVFFSVIAEIVLFYFTDSRTWFIAYMFFSLIIFVMLITDRPQNVFQRICTIGIDFLFLFHLVFKLIYKFLLPLDVFLSFRISGMSRELSSFGWKEFLFGGGMVSSDSLYIKLLYDYGIFIYMLVWFAVHVTMKQLRLDNNYKVLAFFLAMLIGGVMESSMIRPEFISSIVVWWIIMCMCQPIKRKNIIFGCSKTILWE